MSSLALRTPDVDIAPTELRAIEFAANRFATSSLCPSNLIDKPNEVLLIALRGRALGLRDLQSAIAHIFVVDNRTVLSATLRGGLATAAGHEYWSEETADTVTIIGHRRGRPNQITRVSFSMDDARTAGLLDTTWEKWVDGTNGRKGYKLTWVEGSATPRPDWVGNAGSKRKRRDNWHNYPKDMLFARAVCRWVARVCPEVTMGMDGVIDTPLEEIDRNAFSDAARPDPRTSFIDVDPDDPIDVTLLDSAPPAAVDPQPAPIPPGAAGAPSPWAITWRDSFGTAWDTDLSRLLISFATDGRTELATEVEPHEYETCERARDDLGAGALKLVDGRIVEPS